MAISPPSPPSEQPVWQAPLIPVALAYTAGIVLDRHVNLPMATSFSCAIALLAGAALSFRRRLPHHTNVFLWLALVALGAGHHQWYRESIARNDIRLFATLEGRPARLRGVIDSEPIQVNGITDDPLRTFPTKSSTRMVVAAHEIQSPDGWLLVSGGVQVMMAGKRDEWHVGDEVELVGKLVLPQPAVNPGGFDYADFLRDQDIGAILSVPDTPDAVTLRYEGWPRSLWGWLAVLRVRSNKMLADQLPAQHRGVAAALLLGEGSGMTGDDWEQYLRTGVIHVLAISGQHLVVLASFLWFISRVLYLPRRGVVPLVALLLFGYALLTGGRPAVMRAAWVVVAYTGGAFFRRPVMPANVFALAWIVVALFNPTDIFNTGCQLSFLAVAVLIWGTRRLQVREDDPFQRLIDESRSWIAVSLLRFGRGVAKFYAINALVWLAVTPLTIDRFHVCSPVALVIGPPMVFLSSAALLLGFGLLLTAPLVPPLAMLFAWLTHASLAACEWLVSWSSRLPGAYFFLPDMPTWWLWVFYGGLFACLSVPWLRSYSRWCWLAGAGWALVGLLLVLWPPRPGEFRCTFLAVGHGGCTILETPNGHVFVYDAGAKGGPELTRKHIAPFLWNRGYRRIDEIIISHGDLDHFNGLPQLLDRFSVGQVTLTPTFADRSRSSIHYTLRQMERHGLKPHIVHAPMQWETDGVAFEALHPPEKGPDGIENERSLVLAVRHQDLTVLLTGDLEKAGLQRVLSLSPMQVDVLMAPHHGSRTANTKELAAWARPELVVSCQGPPLSVPKEPNPYEALGARWASTWSQGAVTIRRDRGEWIAEAYLTKSRWRLKE